MESLTKFAEFFRHVLCVARFGAIRDQDGPFRVVHLEREGPRLAQEIARNRLQMRLLYALSLEYAMIFSGHGV